MVIIRVKNQIPLRGWPPLIKEIRAQAETGVIVLPPWCELLNEVPKDEEIQIIQQKDDDRVAALEQALAAAVADLTKAHTCKSCKHEPIDPYFCYKTGYHCQSCEAEACPCRDCDGGSCWEWRHAHGAE